MSPPADYSRFYTFSMSLCHIWVAKQQHRTNTAMNREETICSTAQVSLGYIFYQCTGGKRVSRAPRTDSEFSLNLYGVLNERKELLPVILHCGFPRLFVRWALNIQGVKKEKGRLLFRALLISFSFYLIK